MNSVLLQSCCAPVSASVWRRHASPSTGLAIQDSRLLDQKREPTVIFGKRTGLRHKAEQFLKAQPADGEDLMNALFESIQLRLIHRTIHKSIPLHEVL